MFEKGDELTSRTASAADGAGIGDNVRSADVTAGSRPVPIAVAKTFRIERFAS
jgi:hypothetical protein